jgi:hypothetical protein
MTTPTRAKDEATVRPWKTTGLSTGIMSGTKLVAVADGSTRDERLANAQLIVTAVNSHERLLGALKDMVALRIKRSPHALHPSKLFCQHCGQNSEQRLHVEGCQVETAELVIAAAEKRKGE